MASASPPSPPQSPPPSSNSSPPPSSSSSPPPSSPPPSDSSPPPPSSSTPSSPSPLSNQSSPPPNDSNSSSPPPPPSSSSKNISPPPPPKNDNDNDDDTFSPPPTSAPKSRSRHSPPLPRSISSRSKSSNDGDGGLNSAVMIITGVAIGVAILILFALVAYLCTRKKKKRVEYGYYSDPSRRNSGNYYNSSGPPHNNWQNGNKFRVDNMTNMPLPPGTYGTWASPSPGMQLSMATGQMISSEMSSNYSGPYGPALPPPHPSVAPGFTQSSFSYEELAVATNGFSQANLLGQGGFGYVHKGVLSNGKEIAVKSLKAGSGQGDREFQAEVEIISRVHHRHLVSLVGYCIAGGQKLLVYEFLPNSTLEFHLHGKDRSVMEWHTRIKIAIGMAKGLAYLHEDCHPRIIHRDIKAANILLDYNFEAKVADFGLAKLSNDTNTHVSTRVMGTFGYLAPEYAASGKLTEKSDVFSFGVMLLELITGRRPVDLYSDMDDSLVDWARPLCNEAMETGNFLGLVDPRLDGNFDSSEMARMVTCAAASIRQSARRRPKMSQIARALEGDGSLDYMDGVKPGQSTMFGSGCESSDYDNSTYSADMKNFRKVVMDSQEYASSEYGHTIEYGLNPSPSSCEEGTKKEVASRRHSP